MQIAGVNALGRLPGDGDAGVPPREVADADDGRAQRRGDRDPGAPRRRAGDARRAAVGRGQAVDAELLAEAQPDHASRRAHPRDRAHGARGVARRARANRGALRRGARRPRHAARGADVFARNCSMCHQVDGKSGVEMGPDLATVRHRPMPMLLADILEPSRSIAQHYETYQVERASGDTLIGVIGEQSPTAHHVPPGPGSERHAQAQRHSPDARRAAVDDARVARPADHARGDGAPAGVPDDDARSVSAVSTADSPPEVRLKPDTTSDQRAALRASRLMKLAV